MEIDINFLKLQNSWWDEVDLRHDPVIKVFDKQSLPYRFSILDEFYQSRKKIIFMQGTRGVGKTTTIKVLIKELIEQHKVKPRNIFYYSCHNLNSAEQLNEMIKVFINWRINSNKANKLYIFIDEITLLPHWRKTINYLLLAKIFKNTRLLLSGSMYDHLLPDDKQWLNVKISPLSFVEFLKLLDKSLFEQAKNKQNFFHLQKRLNYYMDIYLLTGGYISVINSFVKVNEVSQQIYSSYLYWLISDVTRTGRDMVLFRQIIERIINFQGRSFGYQTLTHKTKARTHNTVAGYLAMMQSMLVTQIIYQLGTKNTINKSAAKRAYFRDPFVFWLFYAYLYGSLDYWQFSRQYIHEPKIFTNLISTVVFSHLLKKENIVNWEQTVTYKQNKQKKIDIPFIDMSKGQPWPILLRYNQAVTQADWQMIVSTGWKHGYIISRDILQKKKYGQIIPLVYFLLYY